MNIAKCKILDLFVMRKLLASENILNIMQAKNLMTALVLVVTLR